MVSKRSPRPRGQRLTVVVSVALLLVAGGLTAAQKLTGVAWWIPITAAGFAAVMGGGGPLWQRWREYQAVAAVKVRRNVRGTRGRGGDRLPRVAEMDLRMLRVHPAVIEVPYLHRCAKEQEMRERLCAGRPVLLIGSSMVGKTRLAVSVVRDLYPDRRMLIPDATSALATLDEADMLPSDHVIWLDDLDRYLGGGGLTAGLLMRLAERNAVVATLRAREWDRFQPTDQLRSPEWDVLSIFDKVTLDRDRDRPNDEDLARAVPNAEVRDRITRLGIGEYVGAGQQIVDQLTLGAQSHPLGYALVRGAIDWRRTGVIRPVPASLLPALAAAHLTPRQRTALTEDDKYADALAWATREINPTVALLEPADSAFSVYDFALDRLDPTDGVPPADTWQLVLNHTGPEELLAVGYQAEVTYGHHDIAERAWRRAADAGDNRAMHNLGVLLEQCGDLAKAEAWYQRAAEDGNTNAMGNLGVTLKRRGNLAEAEVWYRRAAEDGNTDTMFNLGVLLRQRGDLAEAETWYRRAAEDGNTNAMFNLGVLLRQRGNRTEAEAWYLRAAEADMSEPAYVDERAEYVDDFTAGYQGDVPLSYGGDGNGVYIWRSWIKKLRYAAEDGNTNAMTCLGIALKRHGEVAEAETWYRRAAENGNTDATFNLGVLLRQRGDVTEAETWYRRAAEDGNNNAMFNLGVLLRQRGDVTEAETWYRRAAEDGNNNAMSNLGVLLQKRAALTEAETWYRRAAEDGNTHAMFNIAILLKQRGDLIEAETWYRRAANLRSDFLGLIAPRRRTGRPSRRRR